MAAVLLILTVLAVGDLLFSRYGLTCTCYEISAEGPSSAVRIVQLTDLHNSVFGAGNERLVEMVRRQEPDQILITGDLLNSDVESTDVAVSLIGDLSEIAPVYFSYGNHEKEYEENFGADIAELFAQAGAHVLEYSVVVDLVPQG